MTNAQGGRRGWRAWCRACAGLCARIGALAVVCAVVFVGIVAVAGVKLHAPEALRDRILGNINADIAGFDVAVGDMSVELDGNWLPSLRLRDVGIRRADGVMLAELSDIESRVALPALLRGQIQPGRIRLSGARVTILRAPDGTVNLSVHETGQTLDAAPGFAALAKRLDTLLTQAHFARLDRVEADNLTVLYRDMRADESWTADGGRLEMTRQDGEVQIRGDFAVLGGRDFATTLEMNYASRIGEDAAEFGVAFSDIPAHDIAVQSPALAWLDALDAPISGALRAAVDPAGNLDSLNATLQIGAGVLRPNDATRPVAFNSARTYFTYRPEDGVLRFNEISLTSDWVTARAEGQAVLADIRDGRPTELLGQFRLDGISANPDGLYPEPVALQAATLDMRLQLDPFVLTLGEMSLSDQGRHLILDGALTAAENGWELAIDGRMQSIAPDRLLALWPPQVKHKTRDWIDDNVAAVTLDDIRFALRVRPGDRPVFSLGFDFTDLETRFIKTLPPITDGAGHAAIHDEQFVIHARQGRVVAAQGGAVDIAGTSFIVPNLRIKRGPARVLLKARGPITAALSLLDEEPFRFMQKAGRPVDLAEGRADVAGQLDFLLKDKLTPEEVAFDVAGALAQVRSSVLVKGRVLGADTLTLDVNNAGLEISGRAMLGQVPVQGRWQADLGPDSGGASRLTGTMELSPRATEEFGIGLPPGSVSGVGRAEIEIAFARDNPGDFVLTSDLSGLGLRLPQLGWALSEPGRGRLELRGTLGQPPAVDSLTLDAAGLFAQGSIHLSGDGQLDRATFSQVRLQGWLDAPVVLVGRGPGQSPEVRVEGGTVDLRGAAGLGGRGGGGSGGGAPLALRLDRLQISDGIALTGFEGDLQTAGGLQGRFRARVNGGAPIRGEVVPQNGRSAFRILSDDAGGVLGSAGLLKTARDGSLELLLSPAPEAGSFDGQLTARNLRIKDAPAMATLLNAISVVGLLEQLNGDGIHFGEVAARFRLTPQTVTLLSSSAVGASMGISMDGYYHLESETMDMQGVVSPFYLLNGIGGIFTRQGEGLFGVSYALTGAASRPQVQVNPFSAFTPAMFREIFRRPPPRVGSRGEEPAAAAPEPQPAPDGDGGGGGQPQDLR